MYRRKSKPFFSSFKLQFQFSEKRKTFPKSQAHRQEDETTTDFEMLFTTPQVNKVLYMIGFYINSKNEAGKDGLPFIITII